MPADRLPERLARCVVGLALFGVGIALIVRGDLGLAPWDVLHQGIAERLGVGIGSVIVFTGALILLLWIPLRERPGIGAGLGPGPRDGIMTGLARRGLSVRTARTLIEVTVVAAGIALGGAAGIGTVAFALAIGPLVHVLLPRLTLAQQEPAGVSTGSARA